MGSLIHFKPITKTLWQVKLGQLQESIGTAARLEDGHVVFWPRNNVESQWSVEFLEQLTAEMRKHEAVQHQPSKQYTALKGLWWNSLWNPLRK